MRRILVTGANGFVCSNIIDVLLSRGWFVYAADRVFDNPAITRWNPDQVQQITGDVESLPAIPDLDALLHGAAVTAGPQPRDETPEDNFMANLNPALAMLHYADKHHVGRAIFISSSAVYRESAPGSVPESQPPAPLGLYAVAKTTIESLVETLNHLYKRDVICIRPGNIYGPHEYLRETRPHASLVQQLINQSHAGSITINDNIAAREWTFAPDIGAAVDALLRTKDLNHAVYNVAAGQVYTLHQIAESIQAAQPERDITLHTISEQPAYPLTRHGTLDTTRLQSDTGFNDWTPLTEGIRQTLHTMQQEVQS